MTSVSSLERRKELKRRRHRREKLVRWKRRAENATASERSVLADKIRRLTPGGDEIITRLGLQER